MEIFIERAFLDAFFVSYDIENDSHVNLKRLFKKIFLGKIIFDLKDIDELEQVANENPLFELLIDGVGYNHIDFQIDFVSEAQKNDFYDLGSSSKIFFTEKSNENIENQFGQKVFYLSNLSELIKFQDARPKTITKTDKGSRDFVDNFSHPCNAVVIMDNYLLKETIEIIEENLIELLNRLMPKKLNKDFEFEITIIGKNENVKLIDKRNKILKRLTNNFEYKINLSIIPYEVHDRQVFTNYFWINSGYGFTLFENKKVKKGTAFTFIPIFCDYNERVKELEKIRNIQKNGHLEEVGIRRNRLL